MHNFLLFYAPLLIVLMAVPVSLFMAKSGKYEE